MTGQNGNWNHQRALNWREIEMVSYGNKSELQTDKKVLSGCKITFLMTLVESKRPFIPHY